MHPRLGPFHVSPYFYLRISLILTLLTCLPTKKQKTFQLRGRWWLMRPVGVEHVYTLVHASTLWSHKVARKQLVNSSVLQLEGITLIVALLSESFPGRYWGTASLLGQGWERLGVGGMVLWALDRWGRPKRTLKVLVQAKMPRVSVQGGPARIHQKVSNIVWWFVHISLVHCKIKCCFDTVRML